MQTVLQKKQKMSNYLFEDFEEVSAKQWKQKIQFELDGVDYNEALIYKSLEGIDVKPFYTKEDLKNKLEVPGTVSWKNAVFINVTHAKDANTKALDVIKNGAESIIFRISNDTIDPNQLVLGISIDTNLIIQLDFISPSYTRSLLKTLEDKGLSHIVFSDIYANIAKTGNWYHDLKKDHSLFESQLNDQKHICIDTSVYQNAGATMIQQLAYGLAHVNEYLQTIGESAISIAQKNSVVFKVAVGGNYFFEIAKLKALRKLWQTLAEEYEVRLDCHIIAFPTHRNKSVIDYNINMLRTTTECMSAVLGGADTIANIPYDNIYHHDNDFGTRIAQNQLLILKHESYFNQVSNPTDGSYYIESLTTQIAEKALDLFKNIEKGGGFLSQLRADIIQKKIKESASKEQELFDKETITLTGINKHLNKNTHIPTIEKELFFKENQNKTQLTPIVAKRLSYFIEKKFLKKRTG